MNYALFFIFSSIEFFAILYAGIVLFRIRLSNQKIYLMFFMSCILTLASLLLNLFEYSTISPLIQMMVMVLLYTIFFRFKILYSFLISFSSYIIYGIIQTLYVLALNFFDIMEMSDISAFTTDAFILQLSSVVITLMIFTNMRKYSGGYAFIPEEPLKKVYKYSNKALTVFASGLALMTFSAFYEAKKNQSFYLVVICLAVILMSTVIMLYVQFKRDMEESDV